MNSTMRRAPYDGLAEWYQQFRPALPPDELGVLRRFIGDGRGTCLDVGCGTGLAGEALQRLGWSVVGVDASNDMLQAAKQRGIEGVQATAESLPFESASFDAAVSVWTHTDIDDFSALVREVVRVLRPRAPFAYIGAHPCFIGPHSVFERGEGVPSLHPGYREIRRYFDAPGVVNRDGVRVRVGAVHLPLGAFLDAFTTAGLHIDRFEELFRGDYPWCVAIRARSSTVE
jgi:SAM-dependent methyltransferase